jgi:cell division protein FtsB
MKKIGNVKVEKQSKEIKSLKEQIKKLNNQHLETKDALKKIIGYKMVIAITTALITIATIASETIKYIYK